MGPQPWKAALMGPQPWKAALMGPQPWKAALLEADGAHLEDKYSVT